MARALLVVLDSLGCGGAPDASEFGDAGANTLGHIIQARQGDLHMPNLAALGLGEALQHSSGMSSPWPAARSGVWAVARESPRAKIPHRAIGSWQECQCLGIGTIFLMKRRRFRRKSWRRFKTLQVAAWQIATPLGCQ